MLTPSCSRGARGRTPRSDCGRLLRDPSFEVRALLTTLTEDYDRVSMSGVREELLDRQAEAAGFPVVKV